MSRPSIQIIQILLLKQFTCQAHVLFYLRSIRDAARSGRRTPYNRAPASIRTSGIPHNMMRRASSCSLSASRADSLHNPYPFHIDRSFSPAWAVSRPHAELFPPFLRAVLPAYRVCRKLRSEIYSPLGTPSRWVPAMDADFRSEAAVCQRSLSRIPARRELSPSSRLSALWYLSAYFAGS